jgi:hypothetical protein
MLGVALTFVPLVIAYHVWVHFLFKGKVEPEDGPGRGLLTGNTCKLPPPPVPPLDEAALPGQIDYAGMPPHCISCSYYLQSIAAAFVFGVG